jgi:hypothetical protein
MRRAVVLFFGLVLAVLAFSPSAFAAKRVALVIGIDAYDNLQKLQKAVCNEKAVAEALTTLGFDVVTGENLSREIAPTETKAPALEPETQVTMVTPPRASALAQELPGKGSPLRAELLNAARPAFAAETGGPVEFGVRRLAVLLGLRGCLLATPGRTAHRLDGDQIRARLAAGHVQPPLCVLLLRKTGGGWSVAEISVGPTDVAWNGWRQKYKIPETLFGP